jgi:hypothetical protein
MSTKCRSKKIVNYKTTIFIYEYYLRAQIREVATERVVLTGVKKLSKMLKLQAYCAVMLCWANSCRGFDVFRQIVVSSARSRRP